MRGVAFGIQLPNRGSCVCPVFAKRFKWPCQHHQGDADEDGEEEEAYDPLVGERLGDTAVINDTLNPGR